MANMCKSTLQVASCLQQQRTRQNVDHYLWIVSSILVMPEDSGLQQDIDPCCKIR